MQTTCICCGSPVQYRSNKPKLCSRCRDLREQERDRERRRRKAMNRAA